jgi:hypothetical protein
MWPPFEPTAEQREIVYNASGFGLPQTEICCPIKNPRAGKSIDQETAQAFRQELEEAARGSARKLAVLIAGL